MTQPEALRLAKYLEKEHPAVPGARTQHEAAAELRRLVGYLREARADIALLHEALSEREAELRRLHEVNAELLEALKGMVQLDEEEHQRGPGDIDICKEVQDAYAAIAKAEELK